LTSKGNSSFSDRSGRFNEATEDEMILTDFTDEEEEDKAIRANISL